LRPRDTFLAFFFLEIFFICELFTEVYHACDPEGMLTSNLVRVLLAPSFKYLLVYEIYFCFVP